MAADTVVAKQGTHARSGDFGAFADAAGAMQGLARGAAPLEVAPGSAAVLKDAMEVATATSLPLELGTLDVTDDGRIVPRRGGRDLAFGFVYRGLAFAGELADAPAASLRLAGHFGKLPYTAELPEGRRRIREIASDTQRNPRVRFQIGPDQDIRLLLEIRPPQPRTPVGLVAAVAAVLLEAKPAIEAMTAALASGVQRQR